MITIDNKNRVPIYEQLISNIKMLIITGVLTPDEQLPSVRQLSMSLGVNPNTVQRAYSALEDKGIIYSLPGRGNFITSDTNALKKENSEHKLAQLDDSLRQCRSASIEKTAVLSRVEYVYETEKQK